MGFAYGDLKTMLAAATIRRSCTHGYNKVDGEEIFFVANPGLGLWAHRGPILRIEDIDMTHRTHDLSKYLH